MPKQLDVRRDGRRILRAERLTARHARLVLKPLGGDVGAALHLFEAGGDGRRTRTGRIATEHPVREKLRVDNARINELECHDAAARALGHRVSDYRSGCTADHGSRIVCCVVHG